MTHAALKDQTHAGVIEELHDIAVLGVMSHQTRKRLSDALAALSAVEGQAAADLLAVLDAAKEASAAPLQWQASTDFTPEQAKDWLAAAVSENVKAGDFTGELHSIAEIESGLTVAFTGCGPKSAANAKFLIWCAHFILKHGDTLSAALRAQPQRED